MAFNAADKVNFATWNQVSPGSEGDENPTVDLVAAIVITKT